MSSHTKRAKAIRKIMHVAIERGELKAKHEYITLPSGQVVNPQRIMYQHMKHE